MTTTRTYHRRGTLDPVPEKADLHQLCLDWVSWVKSKRIYAGPTSMVGVLGKMQPSKTGPIPDAALSKKLAFFNNAVNSCEPSPEKEAFLYFYLRNFRNVKATAMKMGVNRTQFYRMVHAFAEDAYRKSVFLEASFEHIHLTAEEAMLD